jgi:predicted signal transduction protein with EAL and GGDEF domain
MSELPAKPHEEAFADPFEETARTSTNLVASETNRFWSLESSNTFLGTVGLCERRNSSPAGENKVVAKMKASTTNKRQIRDLELGISMALDEFLEGKPFPWLKLLRIAKIYI